MKIHLFKYVDAAIHAFNSGAADRDVAFNQTECGYVRDKITQDKALYHENDLRKLK
jgi:hypothetical protein